MFFWKGCSCEFRRGLIRLKVGSFSGLFKTGNVNKEQPVPLCALSPQMYTMKILNGDRVTISPPYTVFFPNVTDGNLEIAILFKIVQRWYSSVPMVWHSLSPSAWGQGWMLYPGACKVFKERVIVLALEEAHLIINRNFRFTFWESKVIGGQQAPMPSFPQMYLTIEIFR